MKKRKINKGEALTAYAMLLPDVLGLLVFVFIPILYAFYISLHDWTGLSAMTFAGLKNYQKLLNDDLFLKSLWVTVKYTLMYVPAVFCLSLLVASLLNSLNKKVQSFFRTAFFVPYAIDPGYSKNILSFTANIEEMKTFSELEEVLSSNIAEISAGIRQMKEYKTKSYRMNNIMKYVDENFTRDISLQEVAEYANLSVGYLSNYFKTEAGMNFVEYITYRRMERAKELLVSTNDKVYHIAEQVGYTNSQYFTTLFKKQIGVTPAEYRQYL